ncbi:glutamate-cysteine ligase family protein [Promethearchaeum syntrophicum]|uniref:Glutamate-cysteine ligase family protein n=1 Tax=Promethearchaeum syntrophicum TaxID=2594042 RepID=A0A5B9DA16_9ARCH|nr:glutamate-cysteine ligase family protein [Candidatus Prometheoarchaeum syntrophicum]QEE15943.1 Carboxylate-amine ligase YbdK [Candidatus Prometheoarchaeum syntrophicum]
MARKKKKKENALPNTFGVFSGSKSKKGQSKPSFSSSETNVDSRDWVEILNDLPNWRYLPFSHGMEMELVIAHTKDGTYVEGESVTHLLGEMVRDATKIFTQLINYERDDFPYMPEYIRNKIRKMPYNRTDIEKGFLCCIDYQIENTYANQIVPVDMFGRDGNVTMATFILELVTPPCQYAEELAYWAGTLFNVAKATLPRGYSIMSTAMNPTMKEYIRGLSHSDHHHCGSFSSDQEKVQCYSMVRNFIPHIIALSVNSPILNNEPTDTIKSKIIDGKPRYTAPKCIRSIRLLNNTTMLSDSNDPKKYLPYLSGVNGIEADQQLLLSTTGFASLYDARFQDVFPFTKYGTIELRICDAQISICRRIGLAMLIETMYYKARKLLSEGKYVPDVSSESICLNRKMAIDRGLIGLYNTQNLDRSYIDQYDPSGFFSECYIGPVDRPHRFNFQAVEQMFRYFKEELIELGYMNSPFFKPLLQSVFGEITYASPPMTEAEYQLSLYDWKIKQGQEPNIFEDIKYFTITYSQDPIQQPLTGTLTLPDFML